VHTGARPGSADLRHQVRDMLRRGRIAHHRSCCRSKPGLKWPLPSQQVGRSPRVTFEPSRVTIPFQSYVRTARNGRQFEKWAAVRARTSVRFARWLTGVSNTAEPVSGRSV
jgi:hypothetical protein